MARRRHLRHGLSLQEKQKIRKAHTKDCKAGNHDWYPVRAAFANKAYCVHCETKEFTKNLSSENQKKVREIAKYLREGKAKVEARHPKRTFNKDGY